MERTQVRKLDGRRAAWRICESDGTLVHRWIETEPPDVLPLDRGGFRQLADATAFALGLDLVRCEAELLPGVTVEVIQAERGKLDAYRRRRRKARADHAEAV